MKKVYKMEELDCANCASKMESAILKIDGVNFANVNFFMQKLTIDADENNFDEIMQKVMQVCKKIDSNCKIIF